jgi:hypothetical protein
VADAVRREAAVADAVRRREGGRARQPDALRCLLLLAAQCRLPWLHESLKALHQLCIPVF